MTNQNKVIDAIVEVSGLFPEEIHLESTIEDLGLDSLNQIQIVMELEETFGVEVSDEVAEPWKKVQDVVNYFNMICPEKKGEIVSSMTPRTDEFVGGLRYALELAHNLEFALTAVTRERDELREELKTMQEYHQAAVDNRNAIINQRDELHNQRNQLMRDKNELNAIILNYDLPGLPFRKNNE